MRALAILAALLLGGCVAAPAAIDTASTDAAPATLAALPAPEVHEWTGHVVSSLIEGPTHVRPTEDALWPAFQEGILFHVASTPQAMEVSLSWEGPGEFMIMLHSHKADGSNAYVEHITPLDAENPKCLRVPTEDLVEGHWQVMIHSSDAQQTDFTLAIALYGGAGSVVEDDRHGHWLQDGGFEVDEHEILPCMV